jgi:hypothetical protein
MLPHRSTFAFSCASTYIVMKQNRASEWQNKLHKTNTMFINMVFCSRGCLQLEIHVFLSETLNLRPCKTSCAFSVFFVVPLEIYNWHLKKSNEKVTWEFNPLEFEFAPFQMPFTTSGFHQKLIIHYTNLEVHTSRNLSMHGKELNFIICYDNLSLYIYI